MFQHVKGRSGQTGTDAPSRVPLRSAVSDERAVVDWLLCGRGLHMLNLDPLPSEEDLRALLRAPRKAVRTALGNLASAGTNGTKPVLVVFARTPGVRVAARMNVLPGDADF